jgi:hypothetical protein
MVGNKNTYSKILGNVYIFTDIEVHAELIFLH